MSNLRGPVPISLLPLEISVRRNYPSSSSTFLPTSLLPSPLSSIRGMRSSALHSLFLSSLILMPLVSRIHHSGVPARPLASLEAADFEDNCENLLLEPPETSTQDIVEHLLTDAVDVSSLMKVERGPSVSFGGGWSLYIGVEEVEIQKRVRIEAILCLVVGGLSDFSNVSAACRSADWIGVQSAHVISCGNSKRCNIEVPIIDWSCPTAMVVGNDGRGISDEALELSDMHCMVGSSNVSVAATEFLVC